MEVLSEANRKQINDGVVDAMLRVGIKRAYHKRSLADCSGELAEWMRGTGAEEMRDGAGVTIVGSGAKALDAVVLIARAAMLRKIDVQVVSLDQVVAALESSDHPLHHRLSSVPLLAVTRFTATYDRTDVTPLTRWQLMRVDSLIQHRIDSCLATVLHVAKPLAALNWYSDTLRERLITTNKTIEIK
jgi:hypothetical protein